MLFISTAKLSLLKNKKEGEMHLQLSSEWEMFGEKDVC